ncbi:MAG: hypothetical protein HN411_02735 [Waddliaceae bacterium]|nr:hypothetical protein [Waddliaceae bacterium]MBT3578670.1 hypothetical protein [Waddliaceae bacterium]MBT4445389.1 hypothetical protein [Waddliaceae bacterium]MBT6928343.1 hypothetical protein [Waddliaceae bacterium]MBT7265029.1 hypothetical protein [Waddliaceae bacterium]
MVTKAGIQPNPTEGNTTRTDNPAAYITVALATDEAPRSPETFFGHSITVVTTPFKAVGFVADKIFSALGLIAGTASGRERLFKSIFPFLLISNPSSESAALMKSGRSAIKFADSFKETMFFKKDGKWFDKERFTFSKLFTEDGSSKEGIVSTFRGTCAAIATNCASLRWLESIKIIDLGKKASAVGLTLSCSALASLTSALLLNVKAVSNILHDTEKHSTIYKVRNIGNELISFIKNTVDTAALVFTAKKSNFLNVLTSFNTANGLYAASGIMGCVSILSQDYNKRKNAEEEAATA